MLVHVCLMMHMYLVPMGLSLTIWVQKPGLKVGRVLLQTVARHLLRLTMAALQQHLSMMKQQVR